MSTGRHGFVMHGFFALAVAFALLDTSVASAQQFGNLAAKFVVTGKVPGAPKLTIDKDTEICGKHNLLDERVVVDKAGGLANVVVYLAPAMGQKVPDNLARKQDMPSEVVLDFANCRFSPHIVGMTIDQKLAITNTDPVGHNLRADFFSNAPFGALHPRGSKVIHSIATSERVPVSVSCNIHPWMRAYLVIRDNPYMGVSDTGGNLKIEGIPAGEWLFTVWHETGYVQGQQKGKSLGWKRGRVTVKIDPGKDTDLGTIEVPAESLAK
jgi:hypothetical protein